MISTLLDSFLFHKLDLNMKDKKGNTILHHAMLEAHFDITTRILNISTISVSVTNNNGETPLHLLCQAPTPPWYATLVGECIKKRGDVNAQDMNGDTPLHKVFTNTAMRRLLIEQLVKHGASMRLCNKDGDNAIHLAKRLGHSDVMQLLDGGAAMEIEYVSHYH
jgi:ankyrin repeat protein